MISLMKSRIEENKKNVGGANVSSYIPMTCRATNTFVLESDLKEINWRSMMSDKVRVATLIHL